jgi:hypothetical protein
MFSTKPDNKNDGKPDQKGEEHSLNDKKEKFDSTKSGLTEEATEAELLKAMESNAPKKRKRRTKKEIEEAKLAAAETKKGKGSKAKVKEVEQHEMYVLKFNSPILPYSKFPLTHNKYIQEFLRMYEEDKANIKRVVGVHFPSNQNGNAKEAVGIEIKVVKKHNMTHIVGSSSLRFKVRDYDAGSNFAKCEPYNDMPQDSEIVDANAAKELLNSEIYELKQLWFTYNKKINSLLMILP